MLKQIVTYLTWTVVALLLGIGYMRIVLGPLNISEEGIGYLAHIFYSWGIFHVGLLIGAAIALVFILLDVFYLKKKLKNNTRSNLIRFGVILLVAVVITIVHYILEKVIDVI